MWPEGWCFTRKYGGWELNERWSDVDEPGGGPVVEYAVGRGDAG